MTRFKKTWAKQAMGATRVEVRPVPGGEQVEIFRRGCRAKLNVYEDYVDWGWIKGDRAWLAAAHAMVRRFFPKIGIRYLLASGADAHAEAALKRNADWRPDGRKLRWNLGEE